MSATASKCYRNRTGFHDDTDYVEVLSDGTSVIHTRDGRRSEFAHSFDGPITRGDWVEIENPAHREAVPNA